MFYVLFNYYSNYNIYTTRERAFEALTALKQRYDLNDDEVSLNVMSGFHYIDKKLYVFTVEEGETFGDNVATDHVNSQDYRPLINF